jgi:SSS family solute:Na+ symporter
MISVVLADYVQFVVLSFGLLLTTALAIWKLGWTPIFESIESVMGISGFDPTVAESSFGWDYIIWMGFLGLIGCAVWPTSVARALAMENPAAVKRQYIFASISYMIRFLIPYFWGICALVYILGEPSLRTIFFPAGYPAPEAMPEGVSALDNLYSLPVFLGRILPAGVIGIITAGMVAAFMSTHDSYLLCWSSVLTQDVVAPLYENNQRKMSPETRILLTRVFIVLIGLYVLYWGIIYRGDDDIWDYMAVTGAIYFSGAFAVLLGGLYWKKASSTGALLALIAGLFALAGLGPVQEILGIDVSSERIGLLTIGCTVGAMVLGSWLFPDRERTDEGEARVIAGPSKETNHAD